MFGKHSWKIAGAELAVAVSLFGTTLTQARPPLDTVPVVKVAAPDPAVLAVADAEREAAGAAPRFAIPHETLILPVTDGEWSSPDANTRVWRLRISSAGALSLNLGFGVYAMPEGGQLLIYSADGSQQLEPFTADDNELHGELWTPVILADDIVIEATLPAAVASQLGLELTSINVGYRGFGEMLDKSGACNVDVVCPQGDLWRDEIPAVGVISTGGSTFCTGFMVNNTAEDGQPYFMTANHCGINSGNAASLVVYWNFQSPTCGQHGGGSLSQHQTGSFFRASYGASDFTLVLLDDMPNPAFLLTYAGWSNSTADATSACGIHHPNTDEKSISFENQATTTTTYLGTSIPGDGTHVRITDWDTGTTEPGSSGSPLFDQNHRVIGQLHGGYAACGNDSSDWYGRFSRSWTGGGANSSRLSNWLDPLSSGAVTVNTYNPNAGGIKVEPGTNMSSSGDPGGPFAPTSWIYTITNKSDEDGLNYEVQKTAAWLDVTNGSGYLPPSGTVDVTISLNAQANYLPLGMATDTVDFVNLTDGKGDTSRSAALEVGGPSIVYDFSLDTNPGWTTQNQWAFGQPAGLGGAYGAADPVGGHTGNYVYGYNLNGDYQNSLAEQHLTTTALDMTGVTQSTLKFWRWLGVEGSQYDHAYVRVSTNGTTWATVWQNGTGGVDDGAWVQQEINIAAYADNQPTVYVRWTMGQTDSSWQFCGWNIDDVQLWGLVPQAPACPGDTNCDGQVDFADVNSFVDALLSATFCDGTGAAADVSGDDVVDFGDINPFVGLLTQSTLPIDCP